MLALSPRWAVLSLPLVLTSCAVLTRDPPVPPPLSRAAPFDFRQIRFLPFEDSATIRQSIERAFHQETPDNYTTGPGGEHVYTYLAVSGGGFDGAFGAGLINGWTEAGTRPHFKIVTGVSTGALIAPFAFLGADYDDELTASYTTVDSNRIFVPRGVVPLLWSEAMASTEPLEELIGTYMTEAVIDAIAAEHAKSRRLHVASTNLDAEQPVIWDMGAIASSTSPGRMRLFHKVRLASASISSMFPPVFMDVEIEGQKYQEMHVDGGVFFQSFFVGSIVDLPETIRTAHPDHTGNLSSTSTSSAMAGSRPARSRCSERCPAFRCARSCRCSRCRASMTCGASTSRPGMTTSTSTMLRSRPSTCRRPSSSSMRRK
jgi:hypothetical protein